MSDLASQGVQMMAKVNAAHPWSPLLRKPIPVAMSVPMSKAVSMEENRTAIPKLR